MDNAVACTSPWFGNDRRHVLIQLKEVPQAARDLEKVALRGALAKLDSPVEPRTFSTLPRYVIYVRDGNKRWEPGDAFLSTCNSRIIPRDFTARSGRIDSSGDQSELVLSDVLGTKFPGPNDDPKKSYVVERSEQLRISINTGRADIIQRLNQRDPDADTMDWKDLRQRARSGNAADKREATDSQS